jgi:hypothetical protein
MFWGIPELKLMFWGVSDRYCMKVEAKMAELVPLTHN